MKIVVIAGFRTRSSVLQETLAIKYGYQNLFECLNPNQEPEVTNVSIPWNTIVKNVMNNLLLQDNFVTKIIAGQCKHIDNELLENLQLEKFDKIHLIERHDFFESCASLQVAYSTGKWFRIPESRDTLNNISISEEVVFNKLKDIVNYLKIKKFLLTSHLPFTLHNYNDIIFNKDKVGKFYKNNFDYENIITNANKRSTFNTLFDKHFDYKTCRHSYHDFRKEVFFNKTLLNLVPTPNL